MSHDYRGYRTVFPGWDPEDRFTALDDVRELLRSRLVKVDCVLDILSRSSNACVEFSLGDIEIQFVRGFGVWSERRDVIQMTVEVPKGDFGDVVGYEYTLNEVKRHQKLESVEFDL
jgi:hypothetical protein